MTLKRTTHELANMLSEIADALKQMPDMSLMDLKPPQKKQKPIIDISALLDQLPKMNKENAEAQLKKLKVAELSELCKQMNVSIGSRRTKENYVKQIIWQLFESKSELEFIRTYEEKTES
ncbi:MAG: hypothetical protein AB1656_16425 [Candidatus Omnitrophota bacterium]